MIQDLGHYYIWAHDRYRTVFAELTPEEFHQIDKDDRSIKELIIHMISMTATCYCEPENKFPLFFNLMKI